jgi:hypothetical protein
MNSEMARKINHALDALDKAIAGASTAVRHIALREEALSHRMESYKEVVRRQRILVERLERASQEGDWKEVTRLNDLVRTASLMIKMDASHILESLRVLHHANPNHQ